MAFFEEKWEAKSSPVCAEWDWNIYLHECRKSRPLVGKYSIHGAYGVGCKNGRFLPKKTN